VSRVRITSISCFLTKTDIQVLHVVGAYAPELVRGGGCLATNTTLDIPSHAYQFTFASNPLWSRFYARGGEIQSYLKDVAWKYDVEKYVRFRHLFQEAHWDEQDQKWHITIKNLENGEVSGSVLHPHMHSGNMLKVVQGQNGHRRYLTERHWTTQQVGLA
jgi:hypothetical protein